MCIAAIAWLFKSCYIFPLSIPRLQYCQLAKSDFTRRKDVTIHTDGKDQYFSHQFVAIAAQAYTIRDRLNKSRTVVQIKCHKDSAKDNITPLHSFIPTLSVLEMITSGHETKLTASANSFWGDFMLAACSTNRENCLHLHFGSRIGYYPELLRART